MALDLPNAVLEFLQQNQEQKFTSREIATWIYETYPDYGRAKLERSTVLDSEVALITQIAGEIGSKRPQIQKDHPKVKTTESRPRKWYFSESTDSAEIDQAETSEASPALEGKERDLYPILSEFLRSELNIYSKRIDERRSKNSRGPGGNEWLYPDLVGMEDLSGDWHREVKDCVREYPDKKTKLWSFEVKQKINRSNVRKAFFQAVSNSSWANFGYLVTRELATDALKELRMLTNLHGIGFIQLDVENASESQILIPAKERSEIDWDTANRLTQENKNFREYIKLIRQFCQTGELRPTDWD